ncbi:Uncharacterised protein [Legionella pneumophila]|nr:Uncharacterised protein [Legionella pneumophila]
MRIQNGIFSVNNHANQLSPTNSRSASNPAIIDFPNFVIKRWTISILSLVSLFPPLANNVQNNGIAIPLYTTDSIKILMSFLPQRQLVRSMLR